MPGEIVSFLSPVKSAGIDYITATSDNTVSDREYAELADFLITSERQNGNFVRPWSGLGYEGFACGKVSIGSRRDGRLLRITSSEASLYFDRLFKSVTNVSRLDVQVTVYVGDEVNAFLEEVRQDLESFVPKRGKPPEVTLHRNKSGGMTVQSGERTSAWLGRAYNKGFESRAKEFEKCARFEVQLNGSKANFGASHLYQMRCAFPAVSGIVWRFFTGRGVSERLLASFKSLLGFSTPYEHLRSTADVDRQLRWLETQVRPSVKRLIEAGKIDQVRQALGLIDLE